MRPRPVWLVVLATALPMFMATLDNLVVTGALPVIRTELGGSLETLQWVVNAYTLAFATLLLTASGLGDRIGRRRVFVGGIVLFTAASAAAALSTDATTLILARAVQGVGAAAVMPLSLTLLAAAVPPARRALAIGIWGGVSGLGVAVGPLVGGAVVDGLAWQWIFWLNVPFGVLAVPLALVVLRESRGPDRRLDPLGLLLSAVGVLAVVYTVVRADAEGWGSARTIGGLVLGAALLVGFTAWQRRAAAPLLPLRLFRSRGFSAANATAVGFSFGMFGAVFLLAQFLQVVQGLSPFEAGLRTMPWTLAPMVVAPIAGILTGRVGPRPLVAAGMVLQAGALAWLAAVTTVDVSYGTLVPPFLLAGVGMGLTFAPIATAVITGVSDADHGKASGANSTLRELGVALGVAVLTAVFTANGSYAGGQAFVDGLVPAVWIAAGVVAVGAVGALFLPGRRPTPVAVEPPVVPVPA
ncbi:DHA2 family efflux MFS transporter permease subunit [Pseudonocardia oroxyli]|uniref:Drug resistance transporter, EmrB/QacA subfamily n=1 Tax=Pseudonocardia oroxyli TaxID=366584 RepID=A0A1G8BP00_PSEOR|nr:DHA2 family efflux MFS transporter permease subunit [Pseudonocardia oroxyli]SDH34909.1 drug resistance transporter, EmrB/QacA subfamily [Pseudonocardia oroxyli]